MLLAPCSLQGLPGAHFELYCGHASSLVCSQLHRHHKSLLAKHGHFASGGLSQAAYRLAASLAAEGRHRQALETLKPFFLMKRSGRFAIQMRHAGRDVHLEKVSRAPSACMLWACLHAPIGNARMRAGAIFTLCHTAAASGQQALVKPGRPAAHSGHTAAVQAWAGEETDRQGDSAGIIHSKPEAAWGLQPANTRGPAAAQSVPEFLRSCHRSLHLYLHLLLRVRTAARPA